MSGTLMQRANRADGRGAEHHVWVRGVVVPALLVAVVAVVAAAPAPVGIKGSKHDFSTDEWKGVDECGACHTPEGEALPPVPPLWNNRADLTRRFGRSLVSQDSLGEKTVNPLGGTRHSDLADSRPGMGTLSCLQCHDGTIAKDATGAAIRKDRFPDKQHPGLFAAGHGRTDHPVGVEYPKFGKDFHPQTAVVSGWKVQLPQGRVECSSCHDPHNQSGEKHMLVMSNARSALCLKCHKK